MGSGHRRHLTKSGSGANPRVFRMFRPGTVTGRAGPQPGGFWGAATTLGRRRRGCIAPAPQGHLDHGTSPRAPRCPAATRGDRPQQPGGSGPGGTFPKLPHAPLRVGALRAAHSTPTAGVHPSLKPARFPRPPQPPNPCRGTKPPLLEHPSPAEPLQRPLLGGGAATRRHPRSPFPSSPPRRNFSEPPSPHPSSPCPRPASPTRPRSYRAGGKGGRERGGGRYRRAGALLAERSPEDALDAAVVAVAEVPGADDQVARHAGPRGGGAAAARLLLGGGSGGGGGATPGGAAAARMKERQEAAQRRCAPPAVSSSARLSAAGGGAR